jgi:hypothetical protein
MRILYSSALHFSLTTVALAFGSLPCYSPNGEELSRPDIKQCADGVSTMCCALNRANPPGSEINEFGFTQDECVPNGVCQSRLISNGVQYTTWWVEGCTNPDPTSSDCLDVCRADRDADGGARLTPCGVPLNGSYNALDDTRGVTRWCCGDSNACCINDFDVLELSRNFTGRFVSSSASSSPTASSTSISTTSSTSSSTASPTSSLAPTENKAPEAGTNGLSSGAKAGIGVGAAVSVMVILLAAFFGYKAYGYRKLAKQREAEEEYSLRPQFHGHEQKYEHAGYMLSEMNATTPPAEMMTLERPMELPETHRHT